MNKVWIRANSPILGLLLLLSVIPLLSDLSEATSDIKYAKKEDINQSKCVTGSNFFPVGDRGFLGVFRT